MMEGPPPNLRVRLRPLYWPAALIAVLVLRAVVSFAAKPNSPLLAYGGISYFILLLLATGFAIRNGVQNTLGSRPFWVFLAIGYSLWTLDQSIFIYHEFVLHTDVPGNSIADPVLFLHIVPFMAAAGILPTPHVSGPRLYRVLSISLLLVFFWGFLYVYAVFPFQYLFSSTTTYALRFDILYLIENLALVAVTGILSLRVQYPWKVIYLHLLGASALYALSSAVANTAIDSGGYVYGKIYGLGLTASACWFVWIPVRAQQITKAEVRTARFDTGQGSPASEWSMLAVLLISIPLVWELFQKDEMASMRTFRVLVVIAAIVYLAGIAYIREHFARSELISQLGLANERLRLSLEAGRSVAWEWDPKAGQNSWFGDLENMFGIPLDTFIGREEDFYRYVHPEDRQMVANANAEAKQSRKRYAAEFRVVRLDGTVVWAAATGQYYYAGNGDPYRMLGIAVDITARKLADAALASVSGKLIEAQEQERRRIARELHDDIGQRLALLAIELTQLQQRSSHPSEFPERIGKLQLLTSEIAVDIQSLSHELHSSRLQYLGLAAALRGFCQEFSGQQKVEVDFKTQDLPTRLSPDISLCFFRVLQEALHNAAKHSGVRHFEVRLWGTPDEIHLTISDPGVGFDLESTKANRGLGLISMQERLKLLHGILAVESQPQRGTTIHASVPHRSDLLH
jgi:PAS domain S-box-containing protein